MAFTYTVEDFEKKVKYYFKDAEETRNVFPDEAGMLDFLDIEDDEYAELKVTPGYDKICRWARRRRTSWLERQMVTNNKAANGCMNALKQEKNGGYSDRPVERKDRQLIVKLDLGGEPKK